MMEGINMSRKITRKPTVLTVRLIKVDLACNRDKNQSILSHQTYVPMALSKIMNHGGHEFP